MSEDGRIFDAFVAALCDPSAPARMRGDLSGFIGEFGVSVEDAAAIVEGGARRLLMYRTMVQGRVSALIAEFIPQTVARLGRVRYEADVRNFWAGGGSRGVDLIEVAALFIDAVAPRWLVDPAIPAYLVELARYELALCQVRTSAEGGEPASGAALALARPLRFDGALRLLRGSYAVHRCVCAGGEAHEPALAATSLLIYRDREGSMARTLELSERAGEVVARLLAGEAMEAALRGGAAAAGEALSDEMLASMAALLADLSERRIVLGAEVIGLD